jgi:DNA-directed RNA polymerase subunit N (RpoN/RPB10)
MIIPVRCFTCGAVIGNKWTTYQGLLKLGMLPDDALTQCDLVRMCCRRMLLSHVNVIEELIMYPNRIRTDEEKVCDRPSRTLRAR